MWGVDIFDMEEIKSSYWFLIDSSKQTVSQTLRQVLTEVSEFGGIGLKDDWESEYSKISEIYLTSRKAGVKQELMEMGLMVSAKEIAKRMNEVFKDELSRLTPQIRKYFDV